MNKGFTKIGLVIGAAIVVIVGLILAQTVFASSAQIGGNSNGYQCLGGSANRWKVSDGSDATLPAGYTITKVVVKAGQNCVPVYPTNTAPSCYKVDEINGNYVDIDKIGSGSSCKDISHLEGEYSYTAPTPTLTPTPTNIPTPTVTPTPTDIPEEPKDYCDTLPGVQDEEDNCPKEEEEDPCEPEIYSRVSKVSLQIDYQENPCEEEEPTPTPTEEPGQPGNPPTFAGSSTDAPGVCTDASIGTVGGIYVDRGTPNDGKLEVRWWPAANADRAHIKYTDGEVGDWRYALLNTENDGVEVIGDLQNGKHYWFIVAGVKGCAVGPWSSAFDPLP